jgi:hypothetical protein
MRKEEIEGIVKCYESREVSGLFASYDCNPTWTVVERGEQFYIDVEYDTPEILYNEPDVNVCEYKRESERWLVKDYADAWFVCELIHDYLIECDKKLYR